MPIINTRKDSIKAIDDVIEKNVSMAIFCTASHWNTEAVLLAARKFCDKYQTSSIPLTVAITFNYAHMSQSQRVTHTKNARLGFISIMEHLYLLCNDKDSPYHRIKVLPHLDHANPESDVWALTEGTKYIASAMFDAQKSPGEKNISLTRDYVAKYGKTLMVEGIMDELAVANKAGNTGLGTDHYLEQAVNYVDSTGVDFLVADLGTEQQSSSSGNVQYLKQRATELTAELGRKMLVLHGSSSLDREQMGTLPEDGIVRVNMWTKIAREAGRYAAFNLYKRVEDLFNNDFESVESNRYLMDSIEKASDLMLEILETLNYKNFARST